MLNLNRNTHFLYLYLIQILSIPCSPNPTDTKHVNIALEQITYQSSVNDRFYNSNAAVDGRYEKNICFGSSYSKSSVYEWLMVAFKKYHFVRAIRIFSDNYIIFNTITFLTSISSTYPQDRHQLALCNKNNGTVLNSTAVTVDCLNGPQYSKSAVAEIISNNDTLIICEIEVWTMRDLDRNKQDITGMGDKLNAANDGIPISEWVEPYCTWSGYVNPSWWMINLESISEIYAVSLVNRWNLLQRLGHLKIIVTNVTHTNPPWIPELICGTIDNPAFYMTRRCPKFTVGQYLAVFKNFNTSSDEEKGLTICEIEIFASSLQDRTHVSWIVNSSMSIIQHYQIDICSTQKTNSINVSNYEKQFLTVELKSVSLLESCHSEAVKIFASSSHDNIEECQLTNSIDGYYSELDMLDSCYFQCDCLQEHCLAIHFIPFTSKLMSLNRDFFVLLSMFSE